MVFNGQRQIYRQLSAYITDYHSLFIIKITIYHIIQIKYSKNNSELNSDIFLAHLHSEGELLSSHFVRRPSLRPSASPSINIMLCPHLLWNHWSQSYETSHIESPWCLVGPKWNSCWSKKLISITNKDIKIWFSPECSLWFSAPV